MKLPMPLAPILVVTLSVTGSMFPMSPVSAQSGKEPLQVVKYLTQMVKIYDEDLKLVRELPAEQLPPPGSPVGEARLGKIPVFSAKGQGYWIARSSVMLNNGKPIALPPCRDGRYAEPGDSLQTGEMGLGEGRLCRRSGR
jgi:hypothetical protein